MNPHHTPSFKTHLKLNPARVRPLFRLAILGAVALGIETAPPLQGQTNTNGATLQISGTGTNVNLNWNNGGSLQFATNIGGPWMTYSGGVSVLSSTSTAANGGAEFFRVVNNGVAGPPVSLLPNTLTSPLQVETASIQLLSPPVSAGNTRLIVSVAPGSVSSSNVITLLMDNGITQLRDDGQFPDQVAGDGNFSAVINISTADLNAWNAELSDLPTNAQFSYTFSGREIVGVNALQPFPLTNFLTGQAVPFINNLLGRPFNPFGPCSGSPMAYDPYKTLMITNLSVIADTNRTWDNNGPPQPFGAGGVGTKMGAWTFGKLMTDMANVGAPGNTVTTASDFVLRCLESWQFPQTINDDTVPAVPNMQTLVIQPWLAASAAEGLPTNTLDLAIAPFRLLAIVNRVDLRGNSTYGSTTQNSCVPPELAGEARFVFGLIDTNLANGGQYQNSASNQLTVILEYAVPINTCQGVQAWGAQWAALNGISFTTHAGPPFTQDLLFNQRLQAITDQFARAGDNPSQMPNQSAIAQVRFNDFLGTEWALRQFNLDSRTGYLIESPVAATPAFPLNATSTLETFMAALNNSSFCSVGPLLATPSMTIPTMFHGDAFLGGYAPEGVPFGSNTTSGMFWIGTDCADPCTRHVLSLNACNGCHTQETGTSFTHISPRAFGVPTTLSAFLTGAVPPNPIPDPSGCSAVTYSYSDLMRRVQDLNALVTCGCNYEIGHIPIRMTH